MKVWEGVQVVMCVQCVGKVGEGWGNEVCGNVCVQMGKVVGGGQGKGLGVWCGKKVCVEEEETGTGNMVNRNVYVGALASPTIQNCMYGGMA